MKLEKDIQEDIIMIAEILISCRELTYDSYYMLLTDTSEKTTVIFQDKFLVRVRESFWKLAIIELTKIYGDNADNDHYSVPILISNLKRRHASSAWKNKITSDELRLIHKSLKALEIKNQIKKLLELRNQHYAHTDKSPKNNIYDVKFYFDDCISLIKNAENIILKLSVVFDCKIEFPNYTGEHMNEFLDRHIEFRTLSAPHRPGSHLFINI